MRATLVDPGILILGETDGALLVDLHDVPDLGDAFTLSWTLFPASGADSPMPWATASHSTPVERESEGATYQDFRATLDKDDVPTDFPEGLAFLMLRVAEGEEITYLLPPRSLAILVHAALAIEA